MGGHRGALREESFPISSFIGIPIPVPLSTSSVHFAGWIGNEGWRKESKYRVFYGLIQAGRDVLPIGWEEYRQTGIYRSSIESKVLKAISFPLILMQVAYWVGGPTGTQKQIGAGCAAWNEPIRGGECNTHGCRAFRLDSNAYYIRRYTSRGAREIDRGNVE